ncbi:slipin family protein [Nonomuraea terrae]|uniref:slipin family protein n=1 Tax=Nonomuraea terrae TaxID=2530383 RepID=UPI0037B28C9B
MAHVTVMEWQRVLMYVDGRLRRVLEPGRHRHRARRTTLLTVDLRPRLLNVPGQEVLTSDGVSVRVTVTARWKIADVVAFTGAAAAPEQFLYATLQDAVRERVSGLTLEAALADRSALSDGLTEPVQAAVTELGIEVSDVRVRDLMLPGELRRAAMDAVVARERGKAALEEARAEAAALRSLANTARLIEEHPALLRLRTLQVAADRQTTLVLDPRAGEG